MLTRSALLDALRLALRVALVARALLRNLRLLGQPLGNLSLLLRPALLVKPVTARVRENNITIAICDIDCLKIRATAYGRTIMHAVYSQ